MNIHQVPCLRILAPFCIGIITGWLTNSYTPIIILTALAVAVWITAVFKERRGVLYNNRHIRGIALTLLCIAAGIGVFRVTPATHADTTPTALETKALQIREKLIGIYTRYVDADNIPILQAITLGKKDEISRSVKQNFSFSGGSHVLAVSGLHVGIIYMIMLWIAGLLPYKRTRFVLTHIIIILTLWLYAFICGLPASVVRSALMFSLVSGAFITERQNLSLNSVFASALIMLIIKPQYLFEVGFQLSYAAVISILLFYPKLHELLTFKNKSAEWIWSMIAVSASAEAGTMPLTVYYFHQIPSYSLLTNFLVIPSAFFLVYTGALILVFGNVSATLGGMLGSVANFLVSTLLDGVQAIVELPYSVIRHVVIEPWTVAGLYAILITIWMYITTRRCKFLQMSLIFIIGLQIVDLKFIIFAD